MPTRGKNAVDLTPNKDKISDNKFEEKVVYNVDKNLQYLITDNFNISKINILTVRLSQVEVFKI